ncbi:MAG: DNA/RNA non-specific endonuclease [Lentimicrobium sp.]|nr:DNA/RNA non-specific endonuclease [Lentimicrobium sp.]
MKKILIQILLLLPGLLVFSSPQFIAGDQTDTLSNPSGADTGSLLINPDSVNSTQVFLPTAIANELRIDKAGYSISYNCYFNIANWVAWELTAEETRSKVKRKNHFKPDPMLDSCKVVPGDYARSGFDKGHLAPSADMCWSLQAMEESFFMTNMAPQKPRFNRGIWKRLEDQSRDWAVENNSVYIITGPILREGLPTIGNNKVSVPEYFYRVIMDISEPEVKGIAFVIANKRLSGALTDFAVSIDSVETLTGLDFFSSLPDALEVNIEQSFNPVDWLWNGKELKTEEEEDEED